MKIRRKDWATPPSPWPILVGLLVAELAELEVLEGDLHRPAAVQLPGDDAGLGHLLEVAVDGRLSVELDGDVLADALDGVVIEVVWLEHLLDELLRGRLHHAAEVLAVEAAPELLADVALRPLDGVLLLLEDFATDLHAAVALAVGEPDLEAQLEIAVLLLAA